MSSNFSSSSGGSKGNKWTNKIFFNLNADSIILCEFEVKSIIFSIIEDDTGIYGLIEDGKGIHYLIIEDDEVEYNTDIYYIIYDYTQIEDSSRNQCHQDETLLNCLFYRHLDDPIFSCAIDDGLLMFYVFEDSEGIHCYIEDETGIYSLIRGDPTMSDDCDDKQLMDTFNSLVDTEENIEIIHAYKHKLSKMQLTSFLIYHLFIVVKTANWWWSIEKNSEGISIQRSKNQFAVTRLIRQENRVSSITLVKESTGRRSVGDLIRWLKKENEFHKRYHFLFSNCQTFAKRVFNYVAECSNLYWFDGAFS